MMGANGGEPVLEARSLVKEYREGDAVHRVLDQVSLAVAAGSFLSIMGPSGSGKSTLLHLLGGLDRPDEGEVRLRGRPLSSLPDDERTRLRGSEIGIVYQFFNLIPVLTAEENVALPAVIAGRPEREYRARRDEVLELVGLAEHRHKQPAQLSGGQQQRVAIARALFIEPAVLLADEPTGNLDQGGGAEVLALFASAQQHLGQTVVMVTHDPRSAGVGDEVMVLQDGRVDRRVALADVCGASATADPMHPDRGRAVLRWLEGDPDGPEGPGGDVVSGFGGVDGRTGVDGTGGAGGAAAVDGSGGEAGVDGAVTTSHPPGSRGATRRRPLQAGPDR